MNDRLAVRDQALEAFSYSVSARAARCRWLDHARSA